jgi:outer membrane protein assembly factor BamB
VWGDRIFVLTAIQTDPRAESGRGSLHQFVVLCYDRRSGDEIWRQVAAELVPHEGHHETNTFASGSAVTDGERVYASFGSRGIYCYDMEGNLKWDRDLGDMQTRRGFGEGATPALHGDTLVVTWDHEEQSSIYALDASTGQTKWQENRNEVTTWATPLVTEANGRTQVVAHGSNRVIGYDLDSGEKIWECGGQASNPIASPLRDGDVVYCTTGHQGNAVYAIPLDAQGDITNTDKVVWSTQETGSYIASPVLVDGLLYVTHGRDATLSCINAETGEHVYGPERIPGMRERLYASLVAADDRIYITDRTGKTVVIKQGPEFQILATNELGEGIDASPAVVGKQMFIRGAEHLYCIEAP